MKDYGYQSKKCDDMGLNVCVIGAGNMGKTHIEMYSKSSDIDFIGVVDTDESLKSLINKKFDVAFESELSKLLFSKNIDLVSVCTPTYTHFSIISELIDARIKNILVEKPLTLNLSEAKKLEQPIKTGDIRLMVAMVERFNNCYINVKEKIEKNKIGKIKSISTNRFSLFPFYSRWYIYKEKSGGPILDLGIHDIDLLRWLLSDEVREVYSSSKNYHGHQNIGKTYDVNLTFNSGIKAACQLGYFLRKKNVSQENFKTDLNIVETNRRLYVDTSSYPRYPDAYFKEIKYFIECVLTNSKPSIGFYEAVADLKIIDAAKKSLVLGKPINIAD